MNRPLRILYVLPYTPSRIRVRPYQIIRHLARMGHAVTIAALEDDFTDTASLDELRGLCGSENVHIVPHSRSLAVLSSFAALPTPTPLWAAYTRSTSMTRLLTALTRSANFDIAHVEHLRAAHFGQSLGDLPRILDAVDCITELRRQMKDLRTCPPLTRFLSWAEWLKLRRYEPHACRGYARVVVTSGHDAAALASLDPAELPPIDVIANGVDLEYFRPRPGDSLPETDRLIFTGKMSYYANDDAARHFIRDVLPRLREFRPGVMLTIAGSRPSRTLRAEAARAGGVEVTGQVDDLRPYFGRASAAVCPMRIGVGIQNKVLEAMAMAKPVVCSPLAARSFAVSDGQTAGRALRIADSPESFAKACAELLENAGEAQRAGAAGRRYVEQHHNWAAAAEKFTELYAAAIRR